MKVMLTFQNEMNQHFEYEHAVEIFYIIQLIIEYPKQRVVNKTSMKPPHQTAYHPALYPALHRPDKTDIKYKTPSLLLMLSDST